MFFVTKKFGIFLDKILYICYKKVGNTGHNFWTWNLNKSSKISKDSDFSGVSNKNL